MFKIDGNCTGCCTFRNSRCKCTSFNYNRTKGDTLWDLSRANNSTVETIQMANQLTGDLIHPGDVLTIPKENNIQLKKVTHYGISLVITR